MPTRSKYRNIRTVVNGISFASKREAARYRELVLLERAGVIKDLSLQVRMPLKVNGQVVSHYVADFQYVEEGKLIVEDAKGFITDTFRLKSKLVKALYGVEIRLT